MALNLAALASVALALLAAVLLLRRHLSRAAAVTSATPSENACAYCSLLACHFTSFACPACGHDARDAGLGPPRRRSAAGPFWRVVVFTTLYFVAAATLAPHLVDRL